MALNLDILGKDVGGLPLGLWGAVGVGALAIGTWVNNQRTASTASPAVATNGAPASPQAAAGNSYAYSGSRIPHRRVGASTGVPVSSVQTSNLPAISARPAVSVSPANPAASHGPVPPSRVRRPPVRGVASPVGVTNTRATRPQPVTSVAMPKGLQKAAALPVKLIPQATTRRPAAATFARAV